MTDLYGFYGRLHWLVIDGAKKKRDDCECERENQADACGWKNVACEILHHLQPMSIIHPPFSNFKFDKHESDSSRAAGDSAGRNSGSEDLARFTYLVNGALAVCIERRRKP